MSKNTRKVSISGPRYARLRAHAKERGVTMASLVESRLVSMLDEHDAQQRALAEKFPPAPKRQRVPSPFNRHSNRRGS